jgi:hypothetical protein
MGLARIFLFFLTVGVLTSCARYGIPLYDSDDHERFTERIPLPASKLKSHLEHYLRREKLLARIVPDPKQRQTYFEGPWLLDYSLRYYYLHWDERDRHKVQWKSVWRVKEISKNESELSAEVFEILFWGPAEATPMKAETASGNWVQTPPDGYRLAREFGKYLRLVSPGHSNLARIYDRFKVPDLKFPPKAKGFRDRDNDVAIFSGPYFF